MKPTKLLYLKPEEITIPPSMPRIRTDMGDIKDLLASIKKFGQIVPVIISPTHQLIDGGRRLAACTLGQVPVLCIYQSDADPIRMRELELESNIKRKAFTPAEEVLAVREVHLLRQQLNKSPKGESLRDTARALNRPVSTVHRDLKLAELVQQFPKLRKAKTKSELLKHSDNIDRIGGLVLAGIDTPSSTTDPSTVQNGGNGNVQFLNMPAKELFATLQANSVDIILTDPPYQIDIDNWAGTRIGLSYEDSGKKEDMFEHFRLVAQEGFRVTKETGCCYCFCGPEFVNDVQQLFREAGWLVRPKPLIWTKPGMSVGTNVYAWPTSNYECFIFARKKNAKLTIAGRHDVLSFGPTLPTERIHISQKPVDLLTEMLERVAIPGMVVLDPFAGSASIGVAALQMGLRVVLGEIDSGIWLTAKGRLEGVGK